MPQNSSLPGLDIQLKPFTPLWDANKQFEATMKLANSLARASRGAGGGQAGMKAVYVGLDQNTGEPIYRYVPKGMSEKQSERFFQDEAAWKAKQEIFSDPDLTAKVSSLKDMDINKAEKTLKDILRTDIPAIQQKTGLKSDEVLRGYFAPVAQELATRREEIEKSVGLGSLIDQIKIGGRKTWDHIVSGAATAEERLDRAEATRKYTESIIKDNPYLQDKAKRDDMGILGYDSLGSTALGIAGHLAEAAPELAAVMGAAKVGAAVGSAFGPVGTVIGGLGAGALTMGEMSPQAFAEQVEADPNLTREQKLAAIESGVNTARAIGAATGAIPAVAQPVGRAVARGLAKVMPGVINQGLMRLGTPSTTPPGWIGRSAISAGEIGAMNTVGAIGGNLNYAQATGQDVPLMRGVPEGLQSAVLMAPFFGAPKRAPTMRMTPMTEAEGVIRRANTPQDMATGLKSMSQILPLDDIEAMRKNFYFSRKQGKIFDDVLKDFRAQEVAAGTAARAAEPTPGPTAPYAPTQADMAEARAAGMEETQPITPPQRTDPMDPLRDAYIKAYQEAYGIAPRDPARPVRTPTDEMVTPLTPFGTLDRFSNGWTSEASRAPVLGKSVTPETAKSILDAVSSAKLKNMESAVVAAVDTFGVEEVAARRDTLKLSSKQLKRFDETIDALRARAETDALAKAKTVPEDVPDLLPPDTAQKQAELVAALEEATPAPAKETRIREAEKLPPEQQEARDRIARIARGGPATRTEDLTRAVEQLDAKIVTVQKAAMSDTEVRAILRQANEERAAEQLALTQKAQRIVDLVNRQEGEHAKTDTTSVGTPETPKLGPAEAKGTTLPPEPGPLKRSGKQTASEGTDTAAAAIAAAQLNVSSGAAKGGRTGGAKEQGKRQNQKNDALTQAAGGGNVAGPDTGPGAGSPAKAPKGQGTGGGSNTGKDLGSAGRVGDAETVGTGVTKRTVSTTPEFGSELRDTFADREFLSKLSEKGKPALSETAVWNVAIRDALGETFAPGSPAANVLERMKAAGYEPLEFSETARLDIERETEAMRKDLPNSTDVNEVFYVAKTAGSGEPLTIKTVELSGKADEPVSSLEKC